MNIFSVRFPLILVVLAGQAKYIFGGEIHSEAIEVSLGNPGVVKGVDGNRSEQCDSVCMHKLNPASGGCDFYRLRERIPRLRSCVTGRARNCFERHSAYCYNPGVAKAIRNGLHQDFSAPTCTESGFQCGGVQLSAADLAKMNCRCSIKCVETCL